MHRIVLVEPIDLMKEIHCSILGLWEGYTWLFLQNVCIPYEFRCIGAHGQETAPFHLIVILCVTYF
jgi:hypothetical protein